MKTINELSKLYYDIALECKKKYYIPNTDITRAKKLRKYQILYRNSFIITSVILEDEDTSIANLKEMLSNGIDVIKLMNMIDRCLEVIDAFRYIMPIYVLFDRVIPADDVCNLIIKKYGKDYKIHWDNFKKLMNLKSLLYKHIDTV